MEIEVLEVIKTILGFVGIITLFSAVIAIFKYVKLEINNSKLSQAIDIVIDVVDKINQTYVDNLKNDGMFNKDAQQRALNLAIIESEKLMTNEIAQFIQKNYGDLDEWITTKVEAYIKQSKNKSVVVNTNPSNKSKTLYD